MKKIYIFIVLLMLASCQIFNPESRLTGKLKGTITYEKGPISNANIAISQSGKIYSTTQSDTNGCYTIKAIYPGQYDVRVSSAGYQTQKMINVLIRDRITFIDFKLAASTSEKDTIIPIQMPLIDKD